MNDIWVHNIMVMRGRNRQIIAAKTKYLYCHCNLEWPNKRTNQCLDGPNQTPSNWKSIMIDMCDVQTKKTILFDLDSITRCTGKHANWIFNAFNNLFQHLATPRYFDIYYWLDKILSFGDELASEPFLKSLVELFTKDLSFIQSEAGIWQWILS